MQDDALHAYNNRARNQTTSVIYYYGWVYSFCFFFLTGASLTYMTIENEPVMATFNWPWPAIRWPHLVAAGERPTSLYLPPKSYGCDMHQCDSSPAAACYQLKDYKSNTNKHYVITPSVFKHTMLQTDRLACSIANATNLKTEVVVQFRNHRSNTSTNKTRQEYKKKKSNKNACVLLAWKLD